MKIKEIRKQLVNKWINQNIVNLNTGTKQNSYYFG